VGSIDESVWYRVRIETKPGQGARYYIKQDGTDSWTLLYDSNYGSATAFRYGVDVDIGTFMIDDMNETAVGKMPTIVVGGPGVYPVTLIVTDPTGLKATNSTTVTTLANAAPVANPGPNQTQYESNAVDAVWTFIFSATNSTDDHGIWKYAWDWNNDGVFEEESTNAVASHSWGLEGVGTNTIALRVTDHALQTRVTTAKAIIRIGAPPVANAAARMRLTRTLGMQAPGRGMWRLMAQVRRIPNRRLPTIYGIWVLTPSTGRRSMPRSGFAARVSVRAINSACRTISGTGERTIASAGIPIAAGWAWHSRRG